MSYKVVNVDAHGNTSVISCAQMIEALDRNLDQMHNEAQIVESCMGETRQAKRVPLEFHVPADSEMVGGFLWVCNCPGCGNNDGREPCDGGSMLPVTKYATSGWDMKCLACGKQNWNFFVPQMAGWLGEPKPAENALKVHPSWDRNTWL